MDSEYKSIEIEDLIGLRPVVKLLCMTATTRRSGSFRAVITTRMSETVNRLVVVMHMAHIHHWAIRPRQLDVRSRADKHAAR